jgi:uncharacterized membrane protein
MDIFKNINKILLKTLLYRIYVMVLMFGLAYIVFGDLKMSLIVAISDAVYKLLIYLIFEILWDKWGVK